MIPMTAEFPVMARRWFFLSLRLTDFVQKRDRESITHDTNCDESERERDDDVFLKIKKGRKRVS